MLETKVGRDFFNEELMIVKSVAVAEDNSEGFDVLVEERFKFFANICFGKF